MLLDDLFNTFKDNENVVFFVDIKDKEKDDYLETLGDVIKLAKQDAILHKIILKPGSGVPMLALDEYKTYLNGENLWHDFKHNTNISPVLYNDTGASKYGYKTAEEFYDYLKEWTDLPSLIDLELYYKSASHFFLTPDAKFNNKSPVKYLQDKGFCTLMSWEEYQDCRGGTNGRGRWTYHSDLDKPRDWRGNIEWVLGNMDNSGADGLLPNAILTDYPQATKAILDAFNLLRD